MDVSKITEWAGRASAASLLTIALYAGQAGVWVWGSTLDDMKKQRDVWQAVALKATHLAERAVPAMVGAAPGPPATPATPPGAIHRKLDALNGQLIGNQHE